MSTPFPEWVEPMAATLTQDRFTGPEWTFERKFDGIRLLAFKQDATIRLLSRNRLPQNCPPIAGAIAALPLREVILDGELTWDATKPDGTPRKLLDVTKLRTLGWKPSIPLRDGIAQTYEWFLANYVQR